MADIRTLRLKAREVGVKNFRGMSEKELRAAIAAANGSTPTTKRVVKKAAVKKAAPAPVKRGPGRPKGSTNKLAPVRTTVKRGPGRPKGSRTTKPVPAPARRGRPPKAATAPRATSTRRQTQPVSEPTGRHTLNGVDYSIDHEDWNPRATSITGQIFKMLRKYRGNRDKVVAALLPRVNDLFGAKKRTGAKWLKGEREAMLEYRVARTAWDYAVKTGQHEIAEDRVEYGTGGTGQGIFKRKPVKKATTTRAAVKPAKAVPARRGRKPQPTAAKPAQARTVARRGRPPKRQTGRKR